jgi:hypothetical protein
MTQGTANAARGDVREDLSALLERWVAHDLITPQQAQRILADELTSGPVTPPPPTRSRAERTSLVTEALGYVGGLLILIAGAIIAGRYFANLGVGGRLVVTAVAGALLFGAGAVMSERLGAAGSRLRAVLWLLSAGAVAAFLGLLGAETFDWAGDDVALLTGAGTALYAGTLWSRHRTILQQAAVLIALAATAASAAAQLPEADEGAIGLAVWGVGAIWLLLGWGRLVGPRYATYVLGGAVAITGAQVAMIVDWGSGLALGTVAALVLGGVLLRDLVLLGIGSLGTLMIVPAVMERFFADTLAAPLALLAAGALLVAAALSTAHRRAATPAANARELTLESRPTVLATVVGLTLLVAVAVVALGAT